MLADSDNWLHVDEWYDTVIETRPFVLTDKSMVDLDSRWTDDRWVNVDDWWESFVDGYSTMEISRDSVALDRRWNEDSWSDLNSWWNAYADIQQEALGELSNVLDEVQRAWERSDSTYKADPLATDWRTDPRSTGPLRINQEENWSQWLAHLVRSSPPSMRRNLFGPEFAEQPTSVRREVHLPDPDSTDRYADVLVFYDDVGVSIEVKRGDERYGKTVHTASLVESEYPERDWTHVLLAPDYKLPQLRRSFEERLEEPANQPSVIRSPEVFDITVLHWRHISQTLRAVLQNGIDLDPHWESSAYLFVTLIEQKMLRFTPIPVAKQLIDADDVVQTSGTDIGTQIAYLRDTLEARTDE